MRAGVVLGGQPPQVLWWGMVASTLANIWGVWFLLWRRWGKRAPLGVAVGWAVILGSSWAWLRTPNHWYLGWVPILLWAVLQWWDLLVERKTVSWKQVLLSHTLLLAQSVYYSVFLLLLAGLAVDYSVPARARDLTLHHACERELTAAASARLPIFHQFVFGEADPAKLFPEMRCSGVAYDILGWTGLPILVHYRGGLYAPLHAGDAACEVWRKQLHDAAQAWARDPQGGQAAVLWFFQGWSKELDQARTCLRATSESVILREVHGEGRAVTALLRIEPSAPGRD